MSVATQSPPPEVSSLVDRRYRLTLDRYYRMIEAGIFTEEDPVYLWEGQLVTKITKNPPHDFALGSLDHLMNRLVPDGWHVRQEQGMEVADAGVPEPDLTVTRGSRRDYLGRRPTTRDVALVVEVADTSLPFDSGEVLETYAREAIPVYWIVNIPSRRIEVYTQPTGPAERPSYGHLQVYGPDEEVPVVLDGREVGRIAVRDVLP